MSFRYSTNSPVSSLSMPLIISSGKRLCANRSGADFCGAILRYARISSWVIDFNCDCLICVLWAGAYSLFYLLMRWDVSWGDRRGVAGSSNLGGTAKPLEVFLSVISLGLVVTHCWDVGKFAGVWALSLVAVIQIRTFVVVQPSHCWSVLVVQVVESVVDSLDVSIPA